MDQNIRVIFTSVVESGLPRSQEVRVPSNVVLATLIPALITKLNLPLRDLQGNKLAYRVHYEDSKEELKPDKSFIELGVKDGHALTIRGEEKTLNQPDIASPDSGLVDQLEPSSQILIPLANMEEQIWVPIEDVYRLENSREKENSWSSKAGIFGGAILGIISNWATSEPLTITTISVATIGAFIIFTGLSWMKSRRNMISGDRLREQMEKYKFVQGTNK
jgi:hypothetical protein